MAAGVPHTVAGGDVRATLPGRIAIGLAGDRPLGSPSSVATVASWIPRSSEVSSANESLPESFRVSSVKPSILGASTSDRVGDAVSVGWGCSVSRGVVGGVVSPFAGPSEPASSPAPVTLEVASSWRLESDDPVISASPLIGPKRRS